MTQEKTLADTLAERRAAGGVSVSKKMLFSKRVVPDWEALRLTKYIVCMVTALVLYFASLWFAWQQFMSIPLPAWLQAKYVFLALAVNYLLLIWSACMIQLRLQLAGLQKSGWGLTLLAFVFLNPLIIGWAVPLFVLVRIAVIRKAQQRGAGVDYDPLAGLM